MDIQFLLILQHLREGLGGIFDEFFAFMTNTAVDHWIYVPMLILFWVADKRKASLVFFSHGFSIFTNGLLKATFCVYRPWIRSPELKPLDSAMAGATGYSFPSGHATCSSSFWGGMAMAWRKYKSFVAFCVLVVFLIAFSRLYVGVHTPQDVLVGLLTGATMIFLSDKLLKAVDKKPELDAVIMIVATVLSIACYFYVTRKSYPIDLVDGKPLVDPSKMTVNSFRDFGTAYGLILGWFLERRFVKFSVDGTAAEKVMRCLWGGLAFVFTQLVIVIPVAKASKSGLVYFLLFAACMVFFMTVYPIIFTKIEAKGRAKAAAKK